MSFKKYFFLFLILCMPSVFAAPGMTPPAGIAPAPENPPLGTYGSEQQRANQIDTMINGNNGTTPAAGSLPGWTENVAISGQVNIDSAVSSAGESNGGLSSN